jgi:hypothetical protein
VVRIPDDGLFDGKRCDACGWPSGSRTDRPLVLDDNYIDSGVDGGIASIDHKPRAHTWRHFFSEAFLALLTPTERDAFSWRKAQRTGRDRKVYFELCEARTKLPQIAVKGLPVMRQMKGWRCSACGFAGFPRYGDWDWPTIFVCEDDLPSPMPGCFGVGYRHSLTLGMRAERWRKLVGKKGTKGLTSDHVPVVPASRCHERPDR